MRIDDLNVYKLDKIIIENLLLKIYNDNKNQTNLLDFVYK